MKHYFFWAVLLCVCFFVTLGVNADETKQTVYVWNFAMRDRTHTVTTDNLTQEFEAALVDAQKYSVLDRRSVDNLVKQAETESGAVDSGAIPDKAKSVLQLKGADMVIFGEVFDDLSGGGFTVTVTFEDWKGEKHLIKEIDIPRDQIADKPARQAAMVALVKKIVEGTTPLLKAEAHSFLVQITKCHGQGEDVTVDMTITDTDDLDRELVLKANGAGGPCTLMDDTGNQIIARYCRIANHQGGAYVQNFLVSGVPAKCEVEFSGVPQNAATITRLYINMASQGQNFGVIFKSVAIDRL